MTKQCTNVHFVNNLRSYLKRNGAQCEDNGVK